MAQRNCDEAEVNGFQINRWGSYLTEKKVIVVVGEQVLQHQHPGSGGEVFGCQ